jgi:hypothetical protein
VSRMYSYLVIGYVGLLSTGVRALLVMEKLQAVLLAKWEQG